MSSLENSKELLGSKLFKKVEFCIEGVAIQVIRNCKKCSKTFECNTSLALTDVC